MTAPESCADCGRCEPFVGLASRILADFGYHGILIYGVDEDSNDQVCVDRIECQFRAVERSFIRERKRRSA